jgi:hypothetical protein
LAALRVLLNDLAVLNPVHHDRFKVDMRASRSPQKLLCVGAGAQKTCDDPIPIAKLLHNLVPGKIHRVEQLRDEWDRFVHTGMFIENIEIPVPQLFHHVTHNGFVLFC